jgi:hypothetical protein
MNNAAGDDLKRLHCGNLHCFHKRTPELSMALKRLAG